MARANSRDSSEIDWLLRALAEGYDARAWHGPTLRGSLRSVKAPEAAWRPTKQRHSIWELALHCAYWKHRVRCRVSGEESRFERSPSNFPCAPVELTEKAWRADIALLDRTHQALLNCVGAVHPSGLDEPTPRKTRREQILGVAFHDAYHAGQIRLLKRLAVNA